MIIESMLGLLFFVLLRLLFGYLSMKYTGLEKSIPAMNGLCIGAAVVAAVLIALTIIFMLKNRPRRQKGVK